ncbi:CpaF family protein [Aneurinibacillus sp. BA2021]|nr:CpaF family protein [Aneurinibacillus sp. BA2021]
MSIEHLLKNFQHADKVTGGATADEKSAEQGIEQLIRHLREKLTQDNTVKELESRQDEGAIREIAWRFLEEETEGAYSWLMLSSYEKNEVLHKLLRNMFGYGIIEPYLHDPEITEIMINGPETIFIERKGEIQRVLDSQGNPLKFSNAAELMHLIEKIVSKVNRKVDESDPIVDARLPDGSRVNVVIHPISLDGAAVTIRKFPENPYTMEQLSAFGAINEQAANFLRQLVKARYNIIVSGGTGSGKTTFLNALSMYIEERERVITIEDAAELKLSQVKNLIRLEARPSNIEGKGAIPIRNLIITALRMRPDRIVVGEVRGGEALDMLQAMNTGHDGSITTGHSNSARDMLTRLETMVLMAGVEFPVSAIRHQIASSIDFIVHLSKFRDGTRRVVQITEILNSDGNEIRIQDIFSFQVYGVDENGKLRGELVPTGNKVKALEKLVTSGVSIDPNLMDSSEWKLLTER